MLCDEIRGRVRGGEKAQEGGHICILIAESRAVQQKLTYMVKQLFSSSKEITSLSS